MTDDVRDVIAGRKRWAVACSDAVAFLKELPDDSVDLLFTSPPYESARTYSLGHGLPSGEAWVRWMVELVTAAAPKVRGLIAVNCEGQTRNYSYSAAPFLLVADLKRAGFNLRKPVVFHRVGIPGSGGPDWLRNDWEPVVCVTRDGRLPWSDPTATGHKPKWNPGGEMTNRMANGRRVARVHTKRDPDGMRVQGYNPPARVNPGNVVRCKVGGGHLGHELAHENEAPFPLKLAEFFVKSFCPPDGVCCDPFSGSGTVLHAAFENGRRFVGCDIRESQVKLSERRVETVTPSLFVGA